jgi:hypothetical protein
MIWIIALLCMGLTGLAGLRRGAICAAFTLLGLLAGLLLARPLSPLTSRLLPVLGFQNPLWQLFMPAAFAFLGVLVIFKIAGNTLHQKVSLHYKYKKDENVYLEWERLNNHLGLCVGVLNGALYFFILMLPVYVAGYFTAEAAGADSTGLRLLTTLRAGLHDAGLDRVVAAHDPLPPVIYQAADVASLVLRNPPLAGRLAQYPPILALSREKEIQDIASDAGLLEMIQKQAKISDLLERPSVQAIVTNPAVSGRVDSLLGGDLADLEEFLKTGKSPKFDSEKILGLWDIDVRATWDGERKRHPEATRAQIAGLNNTLAPAISGFSLMATPDNQVLLGRLNTKSPHTAAGSAAQGTWKKADNGYEVTLPNTNPRTVKAAPAGDGTLELPWNNWVLVFKKEM